jgi:hypothetical protein
MSEELYLRVIFGRFLALAFASGALGLCLGCRARDCADGRVACLRFLAVAFGAGFRDELLAVLPKLFFLISSVGAERVSDVSLRA